MGEVVASEHLNQRDVAGRIDANDDGVVQFSIIQSAFHKLAALTRHVKVGQRVAIRRNQNARPTSRSIR